jgi:hypothetical protein
VKEAAVRQICAEYLPFPLPAAIRRTCEGVSKSFRTESVTKFTLTFSITRWEATQRAMAAKLTRLTHKNSDTNGPSGRELYHLQFLLQAASPETFGYTLVYPTWTHMYTPLYA